jgi:ABC-type Fe3+-siderophore transport system permease subunit
MCLGENPSFRSNFKETVMTVMSFIVTFIAVTVVDIFYTYYIKSVNDNKAEIAGFWGAVVWLFGSIAVIEYTSNHWLLIPACMGAFCGTWIGIKIRNKKR